MTSFLMLEDGTIHHGAAYAAEGVAVGELVFTTSMTGYQEVVTDPSFAGQLVTFTQPMIGNYGWRRTSPSRPDHMPGRWSSARAETPLPNDRRGFSDWLTSMEWWGCRESIPARSPGGCATAGRCGPRSQTAITTRRRCWR